MLCSDMDSWKKQAEDFRKGLNGVGSLKRFPPILVWAARSLIQVDAGTNRVDLAIFSHLPHPITRSKPNSPRDLVLAIQLHPARLFVPC